MEPTVTEPTLHVYLHPCKHFKPGKFFESHMVCNETDIYYFGRLSELQNEFWKYNISTNSWKKICDDIFPVIDSFVQMAMNGNLLYVHIANKKRGRTLQSINVENESLVFDNLITSKTENTPSHLHQEVIFKDNFLYFFGSRRKYGCFRDASKVSLRTGDWEEIFFVGERREHLTGFRIVVVDEKAIVVGGQYVSDDWGIYDFTILEIFDLKRHYWSQFAAKGDPVAGYPSPRYRHSAVTIPNTRSFLVIGGTSDKELFSDTWKFDVPTLTWTKTDSLRLQAPLYEHHTVVTASGMMYTFGGSTDDAAADIPMQRANISHLFEKNLLKSNK